VGCPGVHPKPPEVAVLIYNILTMLANYLSINPSIPVLCIISPLLVLPLLLSFQFIHRSSIYPSRSRSLIICYPFFPHLSNVPLFIHRPLLSSTHLLSIFHCYVQVIYKLYNSFIYPLRPPLFFTSFIINKLYNSLIYPLLPPFKLSINYTILSIIHRAFHYPSRLP
jgi:hypothetical protein